MRDEAIRPSAPLFEPQWDSTFNNGGPPIGELTVPGDKKGWDQYANLYLWPDVKMLKQLKELKTE